MSDLASRLAVLSPERRLVLEQFLRKRAAADGPAPASPMPSRLHTDAPATEPAAAGEGDAYIQRFYDSVNRQLDAAEYGRFARFLNYGYVSDGSGDRAVVELPPYVMNHPSVTLVLELIGDCDLAGRRVLDVGCGRGGLVDTVTTYYQPRRVTGVDLCTRAVCFAASASRQPNVRFLAADAQRLPFEDGSFDVVTNLESSHTYPVVADFYRDVHRVLADGGAFLYSDALTVGEVGPALATLRETGFRVEVERDITAPVLRACDLYAERRVAAFNGAPTGGSLEDFLATPGSKVYEML
ncbi:MAG: Methyltransferase type 11, partial [Acidobacteria bacterium]|nr:Methyltransferase type 11 [Acidobacteriota bacterium]